MSIIKFHCSEAVIGIIFFIPHYSHNFSALHALYGHTPSLPHTKTLTRTITNPNTNTHRLVSHMHTSSLTYRHNTIAR